VKDRFTCPLLLLWSVSLAAAIICFLIQEKNALQIVDPKKMNLL